MRTYKHKRRTLGGKFWYPPKFSSVRAYCAALRTLALCVAVPNRTLKPRRSHHSALKRAQMTSKKLHPDAKAEMGTGAAARQIPARAEMDAKAEMRASCRVMNPVRGSFATTSP
jgi:hypothetical protein